MPAKCATMVCGLFVAPTKAERHRPSAGFLVYVFLEQAWHGISPIGYHRIEIRVVPYASTDAMQHSLQSPEIADVRNDRSIGSLPRGFFPRLLEDPDIPFS